MEFKENETDVEFHTFAIESENWFHEDRNIEREMDDDEDFREGRFNEMFE